MSKKHFDLSGYEVQSSNSPEQSAKYSTFIDNEDEDDYSDLIPNDEFEISDEATHSTGDKRINMAFTDGNYAFLVAETSKLGVNFMHFINSIISSTDSSEIDQCMDEQPMRKGKHSASRRKGHPMKRINLKLKSANYVKVFDCAERNDATITTIVNIVIELYQHRNNIDISKI